MRIWNKLAQTENGHFDCRWDIIKQTVVLVKSFIDKVFEYRNNDITVSSQNKFIFRYWAVSLSICYNFFIFIGTYVTTAFPFIIPLYCSFKIPIGTYIIIYRFSEFHLRLPYKSSCLTAILLFEFTAFIADSDIAEAAHHPLYCICTGLNLKSIQW